MRKTLDSYDNLLQGVSQQPASMRNEGQATEQINMSSDIVRGLCRRAPTEWVATLLNEHTDWQFRYVSITDDTRFVVAYRTGDIRAFNLDTGAPVTTVIESGAASYLTGAPMSVVAINDTAYMANSTIQAAMLPDTQGKLDLGRVILQVLGAAFSRNYRVTISYKLAGVAKTVSAVWASGDGVNASDSNRLDTGNVASKIGEALIAAATDFTWSVAEDCILGTPAPGKVIDEVSVRTQDGSNNINLIGYGAYCTNSTKIPRMAAPGYILRVSGGEKTSADDYYLKFTPNEPGGVWGSAGVWKECANPELPYKFNAATMPHKLKWDAGTSTLTFGKVAWRDREVGDDDTNPEPSFIGNTINDLAVFQGRLVFISGPAVIMSRTNKPNAFWSKSATTVSDSDPIDVESSLKYGVVMKRAVLHNRDLVIFADKAQFVVFGRNTLTPSNVSLVVTVSFEADLQAEPVETGNSTFFAVRYGDYTGVREFFTEAASDANNSTSITAHVAQYLEGRATFMAASSNFDMLIVKTDATDGVLYVYQYVTMGQDRAQAAWSKWQFNKDIRYMFFIENRLYLVTKNADGYDLEFINIDRHPDAGLTYQVHLDSKRAHSGVHKTLTVPNAADRVYVQGAGCPNPGMRAVVESSTPTTVVFQRDMQGGTVYSGFKYLSAYTPTRPFVRGGQDAKVMLHVDLRVRLFRLLFENSGAFRCVVSNRYKPTRTTEFSARVVGDINNIIGTEAVYSDQLIIPFRENPEYADLTVECDEHTPLFLTQLQWEGQWSSK